MDASESKTQTFEPKVRLIFGVSFIFGSILAFILALTPYPSSPSIAIAVGVLAFVFGFILLRRPSGKASIADSDRSLLTGDTLQRPEVVTNYRALRELTGVPGFFRNLGITGLPLATIAVTILFCVLAISSYGINAIGRAFLPVAAATTAANKEIQDIIPATFPTAILELSKLLLGAFIGSFVGKSATVPVSSEEARKSSANK